jgi:UDP-4-amino-4,6-dideoxy-N-acetyl-beta-L-altrosamine transaminase
MIPYGRQSISEEDIQAVVDVLRSDFLTQGPTVPAFEKSVADYCGTQHAIAVNSATSALHLACLALDVGPQDVVWTSPITFAASANCALYCGATVDFVDIDPDTGNLSVERLAEKLRKAEAENKLPKVVIPVHLCGLSCDMAAIHALSRQYGFKIIEDASHAIGARYKGEPVGSCRYSDIVVFSFHPVKIITTGEGGMALTNDTEVAKKVRLLRSHGITRDAEDMTHEPDGPWYYQQVALGFNYRMTDIQAALGLSQMQRLDGFVERRHLLAERYDALLAGLPVVIPCHHEDSYSSLHLYVIRIRQDQGCRNRRQVFTYLQQHGIGVNVHYIPLYAHPYYQRMGFNPDDYPMANQYYEEAISLPLYPDMSEEQQDHVVDTLRMAITV